MHTGFLLFPPSLLPVHGIFLPQDSERTLEPARLKGAQEDKEHALLLAGRGQMSSLQLNFTPAFALALVSTGLHCCPQGGLRSLSWPLTADMRSSTLSPLCVRFSEQESKSKWRGKPSIDGTARRKKRAFRLTERSDLSVVASRNLKPMCFAGICCR